MAQQATPGPGHALSSGGLTAIVTSFVFSFLATVVVGLRFYVRRIKGVAVFIEDWLILAALVCPSQMDRRLMIAQGFGLTCY